MIDSLESFQVVAIDRITGKVKWAWVTAHTQQDADDFVADTQPDWIVIPAKDW